jgi:hypothetical protein
MRILLLSIGSIATLATATPADALCFYRAADLYAGRARSYTTLAQEFRDSRWVVRARVVSARDYSNDDSSWVLYTVRVSDRFKGPARATMRVFTYRDSGGFYLDQAPVSRGGAPDYLLFLNPATQDLPIGVARAVEVNFSCGQSRPWRDVTRADLARLHLLARRSRRANARHG